MTKISDVFPLWGRFLWRFALWTVAMGAAFGFVAGFTAALSGHPADAERWGGYSGYFAFIPGSLFALYGAMKSWIKASDFKNPEDRQ